MAERLWLLRWWLCPSLHSCVNNFKWHFCHELVSYIYVVPIRAGFTESGSHIQDYVIASRSSLEMRAALPNGLWICQTRWPSQGNGYRYCSSCFSRLEHQNSNKVSLNYRHCPWYIRASCLDCNAIDNTNQRLDTVLLIQNTLAEECSLYVWPCL